MTKVSAAAAHPLCHGGAHPPRGAAAPKLVAFRKIFSANFFNSLFARKNAICLHL